MTESIINHRKFLSYCSMVCANEGRYISFYEVFSKANDIYKVRIVFADGEEIIDEGNLEHYNSKYIIEENKVWI